MKLLLDTNVAIALEDSDVEVSPNAAAFARVCGRLPVQLFVSEPNYRDVARDRDRHRRRVFRSKLDKYPQLAAVQLPDRVALERRFGVARNDNDECDVELLAMAAGKVVDFLITEDRGLHQRAARAGEGDCVLDVTDALAWVQQAFEPSQVVLPHVAEVPAYAIDPGDPFFDSLREDYEGFDAWFRDKCVNTHRSCWVIRLGGRLAGIAIRKEESGEEADCEAGGERVLKVCTFKIASEFQGEKLGEQLLKQVLWWSDRNRFDTVYLTVYPKHGELIELLSGYGFEATAKLDDGELLLERPLRHGTAARAVPLEEVVDWNRRHYPRFHRGGGTRTFCVPIRSGYHERLFPEVSVRVQMDLFREVFGDVGGRSLTPGNTIRKVYLCRAGTRRLRPGDLLVFYVSKNPEFEDSQCITTLGVVENVTEAGSIDEVVRATARRSVFSIRELQGLVDASKTPLKIIDFLLVAHLTTPIGLEELKKSGVFQGHPPQTIMECREDRCLSLHEALKREVDVWH